MDTYIIVLKLKKDDSPEYLFHSEYSKYGDGVKHEIWSACYPWVNMNQALHFSKDDAEKKIEEWKNRFSKYYSITMRRHTVKR